MCRHGEKHFWDVGWKIHREFICFKSKSQKIRNLNIIMCFCKILESMSLVDGLIKVTHKRKQEDGNGIM